MAVHEGIVLPMGIVPPTVTGGIDPPMVIAGIVPPMVIREDGLPTEIVGIVLPMAIGGIDPALAGESVRPTAVAGVAFVPVRRGVVFHLARMAAVPGLREVPRVRVASRVARGVAPGVRGRVARGTPVVLRGVVQGVRVDLAVPAVPGAGKLGILRLPPSAVPVRGVLRTKWTTIVA